MSKIEELQRQLEKVNGQIAEEMEVERRKEVALRAYEKLRTVLRDALTPEERQAVDGMYLFLHRDAGGDLNVDMVRNVPSATDRGQGAKLDAVLAIE